MVFRTDIFRKLMLGASDERGCNREESKEIKKNGGVLITNASMTKASESRRALTKGETD